MNKKEERLTEIDDVHSPQWLADVLHLVGDLDGNHQPGAEAANAEFRLKCREASEVALGIARLRRERSRVGFTVLSLGDYVAGLARATNTALQPILRWVGVSDLNTPTRDSARALAGLARLIGLNVRETLAYLRVSFAGAHSAAAPLLVVRRRPLGGTNDMLGECENLLSEVENTYDIEQFKELRQIEAEVRAAFNNDVPT